MDTGGWQRRGQEAGEPSSQCPHPKSTRVSLVGIPARGRQGFEGLPASTADLSPAAPPHRGLMEVQSLTDTTGPWRPPQSGEEEEEGHRQKRQPGPGLAQAQPQASCKEEIRVTLQGNPPHCQSQAGVPPPSPDQPVHQPGGPCVLPSPFMPRVGVSVQCQGQVLGMQGGGSGLVPAGE